MILDQLLEVGELLAFGHIVIRADERTSPTPVLAGDDGLDCLAGQVSAQNQHVGAVDRTGIDELPKASRGSVEIGGKEDPRAARHG